MSGRGSITSRTTVSPNSKIEWMSLRSSPAMASSSAATSAIVRISSSVTYGPCLSPFPGSTTLATPMRPRDSIRSGAKWVRNQSSGVTRIAARLGVLDRVRLRGDLGEHEEERDFEDGAHQHADRAELLEQHTDAAWRAVNWETSRMSSTEFSVLRRVLQHLHEPRGTAVAVFLERQRTDPAHLGEGRLRRAPARPTRRTGSGSRSRSNQSVPLMTSSRRRRLGRRSVSPARAAVGTAPATPVLGVASSAPHAPLRGRSSADAGSRARPRARARRRARRRAPAPGAARPSGR